MSGSSMVESLESRSVSRAFYSGGLVRVGTHSRMLFSLYDGGVSVVDPASGHMVALIKVENDPVFSFAVNPLNNSEVFTVGKSNLCRHWSIDELENVTLVRAWSSGHIHPVLCLDVSSDGTMCATSSVDRTIRVFAIPGYYPVCVYKVTMQDPVSIIRFFPNRRALASLGEDSSIAIWDLDETSLHTAVCELKGHMSTVHSISFSPEGSVMLTGGNDQMVMTWDISNFPSIKLLSQVAVFETVQTVLPLSRTMFVTGGDKGQLRLWNQKKCMAQVASGHSAEGHIKYIYALSESEIIAVGSDLALSVWAVSADSLTPIRQLLGNMGEVLSVKWMPDRKRIACVVNDEFPRIINTENFSAETKLVGHTDICLSVAVSHKGEFIATCGKDQTVRVWDGTTFECLSVLTGHTAPVNAVAFTRREDGEGIRVISASEDTCVKVWRAPTGINRKSTKKPIIRSIVAHAKPVTAVAVSGNDKYFASASQDRTAKVFSLADGSLIAVCGGHKGSVWSVDFSPIEQILATASRDGTVKLWNLAGAAGGNAACLRTFEGHEQSVMGCRFLDNGIQLVSSDSLGTMRLWNVRSSECALIALLDGELIVSGTESKKAAATAANAKLEAFGESELSAKIWTMDMIPAEGGDVMKIVTGTNVGTINVWVDNSEALVEKKRVDRANVIEKDTSIQVLLKAGRFNDAFNTAFRLNRPKQMLEIVREANWKGSRINLSRFIRNLATDEVGVKRLVSIVEDWQRSAKTCAIAYSLTEPLARAVAELPSVDMNKFAGFAEKHLARLSALAQKCYIIDAILLASSADVGTETNEAKRARVEEA